MLETLGIDTFGLRYYGGWTGSSQQPLNVAQAAMTEEQERWALLQAQAATQFYPALSAAHWLQNYRPPVSVPDWYRGWSSEFAAVPLCNA
jgi:hypothetical protein